MTFFSIRHHAMYRPAPKTRLSLGLLEDRCTPATAALSGGVLTVVGTAASESITVRAATGLIRIDGIPGSFGADGVRRVVVDAGGGNDIVNVSSLLIPTTIYGGNGNDTITGGAAGDVIYGGNGNDRADGNSGDDMIAGDSGNDVLNGNGGNDTIYGGAGSDWLAGQDGSDYLDGGADRDNLSGGDGIDRYREDFAAPAGSVRDASPWIATRQAGESLFGSPADIQQQLANTCAYLSALSNVTRVGNDLATKIRYEASDGSFVVPVFLNGQPTEQRIKFNGTWNDNDPAPKLGEDGRRDYWPLLYQRAYLQAYDVDASSLDASRWAVRGTTPDQLFEQSWRYPKVAIEALTGRVAEQLAIAGVGNQAAISSGLSNGKCIVANTHTLANNQPLVDGTGLIFGHAYAVRAVDETGVTLRNPWGVDGRASDLSSWDASKRDSFTQGDINDGIIKVNWATFSRAFSGLLIG